MLSASGVKTAILHASSQIQQFRLVMFYFAFLNAPKVNTIGRLSILPLAGIFRFYFGWRAPP